MANLESFEIPGRYMNVDLSVGLETASPVIETMLEAGLLRADTFEIIQKHDLSPNEQNFKYEEGKISNEDIEISSLGFEKNRIRVRHLLKAIVRSVFSAADLKPNFGLDIGSGSTGEMWGQLIPRRYQNAMVQMDLNPSAVRENKERHPHGVVLEGSYLDLQSIKGITREAIDLVTGLSTLDATYFPERVLQEVHDVLKPGECFLHIQDVRPGSGVIANELQIESEREGYSLKRVRALHMVGIDNPQKGGPLRVGFATPRGIVSEVEMFRRRMQRSVSNVPGLNIIFNDWVVGKKKTKRGEAPRIYFQNALLQPFGQVVPTDEASVVVTLVQKDS